MSVYVDELANCLWSEKFPYTQSCHLIADSVEELHIFANRLRLKRLYFQNKADLPHYDLTRGMRLRAIKLGAVEIDREKLVEIMRKNRPRSAGN